MKNLWEHFKNLDPTVQAAIISAIVSIFIFVIGNIVKAINNRFSLNYRLKKEYTYEQRKKIKEEFAKTKTPLLQAAEDINHRLWNLKRNILIENWLDIKRNEWKDENHYYLRSTVYRFSVFYHWILECEKSLYSLDSNIADKNDTKYIKYIKGMKQILTDNMLLTELGYKENDITNHFYTNDIIKYSKFCLDKKKIITFDNFYEVYIDKMDEQEKFIGYFAGIKNDKNNINYNAIKCLHMIIISFLNNFGHINQKTDRKKFKKLLNDYKELKIKNGFIHFLKRNKLLREMRYPLRKLGIGYFYQVKNRRIIDEI